METIFTNYINWLNSKTEQYEEYERDEAEKTVYFKKYTKNLSEIELFLVPIFGWRKFKKA
jgi:hypothetical protein